MVARPCYQLSPPAAPSATGAGAGSEPHIVAGGCGPGHPRPRNAGGAGLACRGVQMEDTTRHQAQGLRAGARATSLPPLRRHHSRWPTEELWAVLPPRVTLPAWSWELVGVCRTDKGGQAGAVRPAGRLRQLVAAVPLERVQHAGSGRQGSTPEGQASKGPRLALQALGPARTAAASLPPRAAPAAAPRPGRCRHRRAGALGRERGRGPEW